MKEWLLLLQIVFVIIQFIIIAKSMKQWRDDVKLRKKWWEEYNKDTSFINSTNIQSWYECLADIINEEKPFKDCLEFKDKIGLTHYITGSHVFFDKLVDKGMRPDITPDVKLNDE